jgi:hypothetical protein
MDAIGHAEISSALGKNPLVIVSSAINLRYSQERAKQLYDLLSANGSGYAALAVGVVSHIEANRHVHNHPSLKEMVKEARPILNSHGIRDNHSHTAVEVGIDYLLLMDEEVQRRVQQEWSAFDWEAAKHYLPQFSPMQEIATVIIDSVKQRPQHNTLQAVAERWQRMVKRVEGKLQRSTQDTSNYAATLKELTPQLANYDKLISRAQVVVPARVQAAIATF